MKYLRGLAIWLALHLLRWAADHTRMVRHASTEVELQQELNSGRGLIGEVGDYTLDVIRLLSLHSWHSLELRLVRWNLDKLLNWEPLTPLTGDEEEWTRPDPDCGVQYNLRCRRVIKRPDGSCWDTAGRVFDERQSNGEVVSWTSKESYVEVRFPYMPAQERVPITAGSPPPPATGR